MRTLLDRLGDALFSNEDRALRIVTVVAWSWAGGLTSLACFL